MIRLRPIEDEQLDGQLRAICTENHVETACLMATNPGDKQHGVASFPRPVYPLLEPARNVESSVIATEAGCDRGVIEHLEVGE